MLVNTDSCCSSLVQPGGTTDWQLGKHAVNIMEREGITMQIYYDGLMRAAFIFDPVDSADPVDTVDPVFG